MKTITYEEFCQVELRSGVVVKAEEFARAKKPSFKVWVDFGPEIGVKQTSAQVTKHYTPQSLVGQVVIGCTNLSPRNIAGFISEFLLTGFADKNGDIRLSTTHESIAKGQKLH